MTPGTATPDTMTMPAALARDLVSTVDAIRGETTALQQVGLLQIDADYLLRGMPEVLLWLAELEVRIVMAPADGPIPLPQLAPRALEHLVVCLSALLVWANDLRRDARISTVVGLEALTGWEQLEHAAGMSGRTLSAFGIDPGAFRRGSGAQAPARRSTDLADLAVEVDADRQDADVSAA